MSLRSPFRYAAAISEPGDTGPLRFRKKSREGRRLRCASPRGAEFLLGQRKWAFSSRGTEGSNPPPSSRESAANLTSSIGRSLRGRRLDTICDALGATSCSARLPPFSFGIAIWRE